jgi:hypothetical protein
MEFQQVFRRSVGSSPAYALLGSDTLPAALVKTNDNVLQSRSSTINDVPIARSAIFYTYTGTGVAPTITAVAYAWDSNSKTWISLETLTLTNGVVAYCDLISALEGMDGMGQGHTGSIEVVLIPALPGGAPNGIYLFGMSFDASTVNEVSATKLTSIDGKIPVLGQATKSASVPVTLASNQEIPTTMLGQGLKAASLPMTLASDQEILGAKYNSTTPSKTAAALTTKELNKAGCAFVQASPRHYRQIEFTSGLAADATSLIEAYPCDCIRTDTEGLVVYVQPPERPLMASQVGSDWTGAAGWSLVGNIWTHAAGGGTGDLEITTSGLGKIIVGNIYCIVYTVTISAGTSLTEKLGTGAGTARTVTGTYIKLITSATNSKIIFTPTNDLACTVDVTSVYVFPASPTLRANVWEAFCASKIVAVALAASTSAHATAKLWAGWMRRPGAVEVL